MRPENGLNVPDEIYGGCLARGGDVEPRHTEADEQKQCWDLQRSAHKFFYPSNREKMGSDSAPIRFLQKIERPEQCLALIKSDSAH